MHVLEFMSAVPSFWCSDVLDTVSSIFGVFLFGFQTPPPSTVTEGADVT